MVAPVGPAEDTKVVQTSKVTLTMPNPDDWGIFNVKLWKQGGSFRVTIPSDIVEMLALTENDFVEVHISKRKKHASSGSELLGGFASQATRSRKR